jgi:large subunit ribosomal protein L19e
MSIKLTKRIAGQLLGRGVTAVRIKNDSISEAKKAITREDVRALVKNGGIYTIKAKHNISAYSKVLKEKRAKGRRRGPGRRKGSKYARGGVEYKKRIRGQRRMLKKLKEDKMIDNMKFKRYYALVKGGNFASKASLLSHIRNDGISIEEGKAKELRHI